MYHQISIDRNYWYQKYISKTFMKKYIYETYFFIKVFEIYKATLCSYRVQRKTSETDEQRSCWLIIILLKILNWHVIIRLQTV